MWADGRGMSSSKLRIDNLQVSRSVWLITTVSTVAIFVTIIIAPLAEATTHPAIAAIIYKCFSFVCHQIPERSFHLYGSKFAVCSRCTGIYAGLALATLAYPLARSLKRTEPPRLVWLFLAAAPLAVDWSLGYFSIWQNNHVSRFATGFLLGVVVVFYILPGLIELSSRIFGRKEISRQKSLGRSTDT